MQISFYGRRLRFLQNPPRWARRRRKVSVEARRLVQPSTPALELAAVDATEEAKAPKSMHNSQNNSGRGCESENRRRASEAWRDAGCAAKGNVRVSTFESMIEAFFHVGVLNYRLTSSW